VDEPREVARLLERGPRDEDAVREAARSAAEKINVADADAETAPPETKNKGALERNVYGYAFEGHGGSPVAAYAAGYPTSGEAAQAWSGKMSIVDLNPNQQSLVVWLVSLGLDVTGAEVVEGKDGGCEITRLPKAAHVQAEAAKGILLGDLVCLLEGAFMGGMIQRPKVKEECMHNINKALAALRRDGPLSALKPGFLEPLLGEASRALVVNVGETATPRGALDACLALAAALPAFRAAGAAALLYPYLAWITFATALSVEIARLNPRGVAAE